MWGCWFRGLGFLGVVVETNVKGISVFSDSAGFPMRERSPDILTEAWPGTDPAQLRLGAQNEKAASKEVRTAAVDTRRVATEFQEISGGKFADATYRGYMSDAALYDAKAAFHEALAEVLDSAADRIDSAKSSLEHLDWQAHETINQIRQSAGVGGGVTAAAAENAVVAAARTLATTHAAAVGAEIAALSSDLAQHAPPAPDDHEPPGSAHPGKMFQQEPWTADPDDNHIYAASNGDKTETQAGNGDKPAQTRTGSNESGGEGSDLVPGEQPGGSSSDGVTEGVASSGNDKPVAARSGTDANASQPLAGLPGGGMPGAGVGSPGGGSGVPGGGSSGLSSAFQSGRGVGSPAGAAGLGSGPGAAGLVGANPGAGTGVGGGSAGGGSVSPAGEFSRNFSSAAMSQPVVAAPPAAPAVPPSGAGAPAGPGSGLSSPAPAPTPSAGSMAPAMSPMQGGVGGGAVPPPVTAGGSPAGGGGPMAPVGSDAARHAGGSLASSASSASAAAGGPTSAGAAASGVAGAAGGAATASMASGVDPRRRGFTTGGHEVVPDKYLGSAIQLVYELMYGSRTYQGGIEWCVGIFLSPSGSAETVVTSNEGAGYVPAGVFLPRSARMLFADSLVDKAFRDKWFGRANPVETMVAYAELRRNEDGSLPLHAVAAGATMTDFTSLGPAEEAGVEHGHLCHPNASPFSPGVNGDQVLDAAHVHRLDLIDAPLLRWLQAPERTMAELVARCAGLTTAAYKAVSARLGGSGALVPDIAVGIYNWLEYSGGDITDEQWEELVVATYAAQADSGAYRVGEDSPFGAERHRVHHDLARLLELLYWWKPAGEDRSILFMEISYSARQLVEAD